MQLSSSDARLCRFITKQQLARERKKKKPAKQNTPILIQLLKTEKSSLDLFWASGGQGFSAHHHHHGFSGFPAAGSLLRCVRTEQGHPISSPIAAIGGERERVAVGWRGAVGDPPMPLQSRTTEKTQHTLREEEGKKGEKKRKLERKEAK